MAGAPAIAGTFLTTGAGAAVGQREDLSDVIERIDPVETPFYSNSNKGGAKAIHTDWQTQALRAASAVNKQPEGFDGAFVAAIPTVRLNNVCQLMADLGIVSDTLDAVDKAGRPTETAYQKVLKGLQVRRDLEACLVNSSIKSLTDPRSMSSIKSWISNAMVGAGAGVAPVGDGTNNGTAGTARAMSVSLVADAHQLAYQSGGRPTQMYQSPGNKRAFSNLTTTPLVGSAQNTLQMTAAKPVTYIGSVGFYLTDFGTLELIIDIFQDDTSQYLIDPRHYDVLTLPGRSFVKTDLAKSGSASKFMVEWEGTLRINAPKAHAMVTDLSAPPGLFLLNPNLALEGDENSPQTTAVPGASIAGQRPIPADPYAPPTEPVPDPNLNVGGYTTGKHRIRTPKNEE